GIDRDRFLVVDADAALAVDGIVGGSAGSGDAADRARWVLVGQGGRDNTRADGRRRLRSARSRDRGKRADQGDGGDERENGQGPAHGPSPDDDRDDPATEAT